MNGESAPKGPLTRLEPDDHYGQSAPESFARSEEHTSELHHDQISYAVFCLKKKKKQYSPKPPGDRPRRIRTTPTHESTRRPASTDAPCLGPLQPRTNQQHTTPKRPAQCIITS